MKRSSGRSPALLMAGLLAVTLAGCGQKGPLTLAPGQSLERPASRPITSPAPPPALSPSEAPAIAPPPALLPASTPQ